MYGSRFIGLLLTRLKVCKVVGRDPLYFEKVQYVHVHADNICIPVAVIYHVYECLFFL